MKFFHSLATIILLALTSPTSALELVTQYGEGELYEGTMFQINALTCLNITSFNMNSNDPSATSSLVGVLVRSGVLGPATRDFDPAFWSLAGFGEVTSSGPGVATPVPLLQPITVLAGESLIIHIIRDDGESNTLSATGTSFGAVFKSDANLEILEGYGYNVDVEEDETYDEPRLFSGSIVYDVLDTCPSSNKSPKGGKAKTPKGGKAKTPKTIRRRHW